MNRHWVAFFLSRFCHTYYSCFIGDYHCFWLTDHAIPTQASTSSASRQPNSEMGRFVQDAARALATEHRWRSPGWPWPDVVCRGSGAHQGTPRAVERRFTCQASSRLPKEATPAPPPRFYRPADSGLGRRTSQTNRRMAARLLGEDRRSTRRNLERSSKGALQRPPRPSRRLDHCQAARSPPRCSQQPRCACVNDAANPSLGRRPSCQNRPLAESFIGRNTRNRRGMARDRCGTYHRETRPPRRRLSGEAPGSMPRGEKCPKPAAPHRRADPVMGGKSSTADRTLAGGKV